MATPRPKRFYAAEDFAFAGGRSYKAGDEVAGIDLVRLLRFGDRFVRDERTAKAVEPPVDPPPGQPDSGTNKPVDPTKD